MYIITKKIQKQQQQKKHAKVLILLKLLFKWEFEGAASVAVENKKNHNPQKFWITK